MDPDSTGNDLESQDDETMTDWGVVDAQMEDRIDNLVISNAIHQPVYNGSTR